MSEPIVLVVLSGPAAGQRLHVDSPILLGRDQRSRLPLNDPQASRRHAIIEFCEDHPFIRDLGSKNGTFVNGAELTEIHPLRVGDRIRIGRTVMSVRSARDETVLPVVEGGGLDTATDHDFTAEISAGEDSGRSDYQLSPYTLRKVSELSAKAAVLIKSSASTNSLLTMMIHATGGIGGAFFPLRGGVPKLRDVIAEEEVGHHYLSKLQGLLEPPVQFSVQRYKGEKEIPPESPAMLIPLGKRVHKLGWIAIWRGEKERFCFNDEVFARVIADALTVLPLEKLLGAEQEPLPENLGIIGTASQMEEIREQVRKFALTDATVLIEGEPGTGKETCARVIARLSRRSKAPFLSMRLPNIAPGLVESELFGHEQGDAGGMKDRHIGKLELADGGTLFIDEIWELSLDLQEKLIRIFEGKPFHRVGGKEPLYSNLRIICGTSRALNDRVENGLFRLDLYERISLLKMQLPPLREHPEDIPQLADHLLGQMQERYGKETPQRVSPRVLGRLMSYEWPGNVRELRNSLERVVLLADSEEITEDLLPEHLVNKDNGTSTERLPRLQALMEGMEREEILKVLQESGGKKSHTARTLGISRPTLDKKIKLYELEQYCAYSHKKSEEEEESEAEG